MNEIRYIEESDYDRMTLAAFKENCRLGLIGPDDGTGYYARYGPNGEMEISQGLDVFRSIAPDWATHVAWFNK